ncbi:STAS domain-containing protein [Bacillus sp. ISL-39]|uniref:STAS domain-containing protein n=1 Tax=Bacillus sp. ISL-39 TaxID=2819124 RepID=UPI001BE7D23F|nr:STAS domain-containing protein [Bacillus sp. ISL-39]MBT2639881.1 PAS domain-containing protein [Bacillus sp. ISL-39]
MSAIGSLPGNLDPVLALDSIGENIVISDTDYNIIWMNSSAAKLLSAVGSLYGITDPKEIIGLNMSRFHKDPEYQRRIMDGLSGSHRTRITIKDLYVTDIVITPIKDKNNKLQGYVVMLMDVTTKAEEDKERDKLIKALSVPMIEVWEKTLALPLIGQFDKDRADQLLVTVLKECTQKEIQYVLIDLGGLHEFETEAKQEFQRIIDCLRLIGTQCVLVGITPELAMSAGELNRTIPIFSTAHAGLKYIINSKE